MEKKPRHSAANVTQFSAISNDSSEAMGLGKNCQEILSEWVTCTSGRMAAFAGSAICCE